MPDLPSSLALTTIPDGSPRIAAPVRNNFTSTQTAVNALKDALAGGTAKQFLQATDTDTVAWAGDYTAYVPVWAASGTAVSLGNGTVAGRYIQIGKHVHFMLKFAVGSTTTFGTGTYTFTLPVSADLTFQGGPIGSVYSQDVSAGNFAQSLPILATATTFNLQHIATWPTGTQIIYAPTLPWTWATGDLILAYGIYEAA